MPYGVFIVAHLTTDAIMRHRVCFLWLLLCAAALLPSVVSTAAAQLPTTLTISDPRGDVADMLRGGQRLELQRRWGEALSLYEDGIRKYPDNASLRERFDTSRLHYDLERRYADRSFSESVLRLSTERSLEIYSQVLLKIESHYVDVPHWKELVERGVNNLNVALSEPTFLDRNIPQQNREGINEYRVELRNIIGSQTITCTSGSTAAGHCTGCRCARISLRRDERFGPLFHLSYARSTERGLRPD